MKEIVKSDYEVKFKDNISQIHSISIEEEHTLDENTLNGKFILSGDYKKMGLSTNLIDYNHELPYTYTLSERTVPDSIKVEINDFTYEIDKDTININVEYQIEYDEDHKEELEELDRMFDEVIDFREELKEEPEEELDRLEEEKDLLKPTSEDEYITYHIYMVTETDTIDTILERYKISIDTLKEYNEFESIQTGMKLIIPASNE